MNKILSLILIKLKKKLKSRTSIKISYPKFLNKARAGFSIMISSGYDASVELLNNIIIVMVVKEAASTVDVDEDIKEFSRFHEDYLTIKYDLSQPGVNPDDIVNAIVDQLESAEILPPL